MSIQTNILTSSQYLFNREASVLFPNQDSAFVNQSLQTLMEVIDHLVTSNPEALFIFDPTAFNNQCHLYALIVAQSINQAKVQNVVANTTFCVEGSPNLVPDSIGEDLEDYTQSVDRRFLYHSFFLSYAFLTDSKLLDKVVCKVFAMTQGKVPSKDFRLFLKDSKGLRTHASRQALNLLFAEHMKQTLSLEEGPLYSELAVVAHADLQLTASNRKGTFYTFPKLAGVAYLIDTVCREKIPLLFKVKVITKEGNGSFIYSSQNVEALDPTTPVIVFEMVATGKDLSYVECRDIAKRCPTHSRRNVSSKDRHDPKASCFFCAPNKLNGALYQQRFEPILARADEMFSALGADFVLQNQREFLPFFSDRAKFPELTALFEASVPNIEKLFLSMTMPLNMSVSHVYTDCASNASKNALIIDASYETHLEARGLV
jgi:hypothetical protein